jgi:chain length determinant protein (polysaccharide antigen chain regulator)
MQQDNQEPYPYQTDEINRRELLNSLIARKFLILGLTAFITLLSVLYSFNLTPIYKASTSFTSPSDSSMFFLNKMTIMNSELKNSVFSQYLTSLSSRAFQRKVFIDGDYLAALNIKNEPIDDVDSYSAGFLNSINLSPPPLTKKERDLGFLTELPYSLSMEGGNADVISSYLNDLVESANTNTINELTDFFELKINNRLDAISLERNLLLIQEKQRRLNEIEVLVTSASMARSLGIIDNNFQGISGENGSNARNISILENKNFPNWYMYGQRALTERISLLENRINDEPFIDKLVGLNIEKLKLESIIIDSSGIDAMILSQSAMVPKSPIRPNKRLIVLIAFIGGFMMSIFLALIMNTFKPDELTPPE